MLLLLGRTPDHNFYLDLEFLDFLVDDFLAEKLKCKALIMWFH